MYPRPLVSIHQIEITSRCNLRCKYCPHPKMQRDKEDMDLDTFTRALEWVAHFREHGRQIELALTGVGEPTLHPDLVEYVALARDVMGDGFISFSTNGLRLTDELCRALQPYKPNIYVSLHRPEKAGPALELAKKYGMLYDCNAQFVTSAFDWAGQVDWHVTADSITCAYLLNGWGVVLADGHITTCCLDAEGKGIVGHVDDQIGTVAVQPYSLCEPCHMEVPVSIVDAVIIGKTDSERLSLSMEAMS